MCWIRVGGVVIEVADRLWFRKVCYIDDRKAAAPQRDVKATSPAVGMMGPHLRALPGRLLPTRNPLAGSPPPSHLLGLRRVREIDDHRDIPLIPRSACARVDELFVPV